MSDAEFRSKLEDVSKGLDLFDQVIHAVDTKAKKGRRLQTTRTDVEKGKKLVIKVKAKLKELSSVSKQRGASSSRYSQYKKVANDFKNQVRHFEQMVQHLASKANDPAWDEDDRQRKPDAQDFTAFKPNDFNEDQFFAQATVTSYEHDDLHAREQDIINVSAQINEVNQAFAEIDGLVTKQDEMVIEIADNTATAKEHTEAAVEQVREADQKTKYCNCSKWKCCCIITMILIVGVLVGVLMLGDS